MSLLTIALVGAGFGILGCLLRAVINFIGALRSERKVQKPRFLLYSLVILCVGAFMGIALGFNKPLSFLAGYLGLDLIDGYYKVFKKTKVEIKGN